MKINYIEKNLKTGKFEIIKVCNKGDILTISDGFICLNDKILAFGKLKTKLVKKVNYKQIKGKMLDIKVNGVKLCS